MPARSKPLSCEAGIQVKREQGTLAESLETAKYRFIQQKSTINVCYFKIKPYICTRNSGCSSAR